MAQFFPLERLEPGMKVVIGGDRVAVVDAQLAEAFQPGDALVGVAETSELLHIPAAAARTASDAVGLATAAFSQMGQVNDEQISQFFRAFAARLSDEKVWGDISRANQEDVERARSQGRSTTRLAVNDAMRASMVSGLLGWADAPSSRGKVLERVDHGTWSAELVSSELGVVAFVFEGRPNVVADATGVLRGGNTVVFRIGRDALGTARAMLAAATLPALRESGLPEGAVSLVDSPAHAAGWALFRDRRLGLAVARGSGRSVMTLGSLAQAAGVPVSLHGTGGAWLIAGPEISGEQLSQNVFDSLDRKVCNTMNTCCLPRAAADSLVPAFLEGLERAAARRKTAFRLHVAQGSEAAVPAELFERTVSIGRAQGLVSERQASLLDRGELGREWEWEDSPEVTLVLVDSLDEAVGLFNEQSPRFVACLLSESPEAHEHFFRSVSAPFVGDGFTRWVDGQYALKKPELGLANWERGRLLGRGGILSGDSVFTVRTRVRGTAAGKPASA
jgi:glutamate-5-semialdehyde dehydrogenase